MSSVADAAAISSREKTFLGHPLALYMVAFGEFCMAFSYFAVQGMFILFLTSPVAEGGMGMPEKSALLFVAIAFGGAFILPVVGGWFADRFLGHRKAVIIGFLFMVLAYLGMASVGWDDASGSEGGVNLLYIAALLMAAGRGLATPSNCLLAVRAYKKDDLRIEAGWIIYYWASGMGYLLSNLVLGTIGENLGWSWGFLYSAVAQFVGFLVIILFGYKLLAPSQEQKDARKKRSKGIKVEGYKNIYLVLILYPFFLVFAMAYQQSLGVLNLFVNDHVNRSTPFFEIPATWFQSLLPGFGLICAPLFSWFLLKLAKQGRTNLVMEKIIAGLAITCVGTLFLALAAMQAQNAGLASPWLVVVFGFCANAGEYLIFPAAAVLIGTVVPEKYEGLIMGVWLTGWGFGSLLANSIGSVLRPLGDLFFFSFITAILVAATLCAVFIAGHWKRKRERLIAESKALAHEGASNMIPFQSTLC